MILTALVSLTIPVNRAMPYFSFIFTFFSILVLLSLIGIVIFLCDQGFYPPVETASVINGVTVWTKSETETYFSVLVTAGVIVLSIYLIPIVFRPIDYLANAA